MRVNLFSPDGLEVGFITDEPEFRYELAEETPHYDAIKRVIEKSEEYEMTVAGTTEEGEEASEYAVTPPEETVQASDRLRVIRLYNRLPKKVPIQVKPDEQG